MNNKKTTQKLIGVETQDAGEHEALVELAETNAELAELHEEQHVFAIYAEFCRVRTQWRGLASDYEEAGDMLRANAIRRSVPVPPEFLDYMKRSHDRRYFEDVILLGTANIYEALLVYGPEWLDYDEEKAALDPQEQIFAEKAL